MISTFARYLVLALIALTFTAISAKADDPPQWLTEAARIAPPVYDLRNVPAVVLRNEKTVSVDADGKVVLTVRYAVRVLIREGRNEAIAKAIYNTGSDKIREIQAWLIRQSGTAKSYGSKDVVDVALGDDLYDEARVKIIRANDDTGEGDVFGFETITERRSIFSQFQFFFQEDLPVVSSQFALTLPTGWRADSVTFNRPKIEPLIDGSTYTWRLQDLEPINNEAGSPSHTSLAPRLAVSFFPTGSSAGIKTFATWSDVAQWMGELEDPQMVVDDAIAAKARDLAVGAKTEFEKIQAVARYVQQIRYISVQIGIGKGGGYRPHVSTEVFAKSYGDCKDKANLMRAMLSALKIQSFMVSITADDPMYVRSEWASPDQFNHCIIAVKVSGELQSQAVVLHPVLGRLLIFDPTDPFTHLGDLPEDEQGSLALIDHKDSTGLLSMPIIPAEMNRLERNIEVTLGVGGDIAGKLNEKTFGQAAVLERARARSLSSSEYNRIIQGWISRGATGAKTTKISPVDDTADGSFNLDVDFSADGYAQLMQGKLLVFKPAIVGRLERLSFTEGKRTHPLLLDGTTYSETVTIKLPAGFAVDEVPDATSLETPFGKYSARYDVVGDGIVFKRSLKLDRSTIPADKYDSVRAFFVKVRSAEQSPVVLVKK